MLSKAFAYFISSVFVALFYFSNLTWAGPFIDNKNGTITDDGTGLVWQKGDSYHDLKKGVNWYDALEYITLKNSEKFGGHDNWRLPSLTELNNLWLSSGKVKSKDDETLGLASAFQSGGSYYLWTGKERGLDHAWYFGLGQKENYFNLKDLADLDQGVKMVRQRDAL